MISIVGLGFVGLSTALGFAHHAFKVKGYDSHPPRSKLLKNNLLPFHEPFMEEQLALHNGCNFLITEDLEECLEGTQAIFFCVGTPCSSDGEVDLSILLKAIEDVLKIISPKEKRLLIIRSTVPPSTTLEILEPFIKKCGFVVGCDIELCTNPEFLREGYAWSDFINSDRIVIGDAGKNGAGLLEKYYLPFNTEIIKVSCSTAEFIKYLSNTLLATLISFSNEQRMLAGHLDDIDVATAFQTLHKDRRWRGDPAAMINYVFPGSGFGGYCLPKDTQALCNLAKSKGHKMNVLEKVLETNIEIKNFVVDETVKKTSVNDCIGILGLSFKPNSSDVRETPSKDIIMGLLAKGYKRIIAYDPMGEEAFKNEFNLPIKYVPSLEELIDQVSFTLVITDWREFFNKKCVIEQKGYLDLRYLFSNDQFFAG